MITKELINKLFDVCEKLDLDFTIFNIGLHEDSLEIYTAEEHDEYLYHGSMGVEAKCESDITDFLRSVRAQNKYYKNKENNID
jgi:hypothetical protein